MIDKGTRFSSLTISRSRFNRVKKAASSISRSIFRGDDRLLAEVLLGSEELIEMLLLAELELSFSLVVVVLLLLTGLLSEVDSLNSRDSLVKRKCSISKYGGISRMESSRGAVAGGGGGGSRSV